MSRTFRHLIQSTLTDIMRLPRGLFRFLSLSLIISGFMYQSLEIFIEYFKYKTITHMSIIDYPPKREIPTILICSLFHTTNYTHEAIKEIFEHELTESIDV